MLLDRLPVPSRRKRRGRGWKRKAARLSPLVSSSTSRSGSVRPASQRVPRRDIPAPRSGRAFPPGRRPHRQSGASVGGTAIRYRGVSCGTSGTRKTPGRPFSSVWVSHKNVVIPKTFSTDTKTARNLFSHKLPPLPSYSRPPAFCASPQELSDLFV